MEMTEKTRVAKPLKKPGVTIFESPHKHFVDQLLAVGYSTEDISRILWTQFKYKVSGMTIQNYKKNYFEPMKEQIKNELIERELLEQAARRDLTEAQKLQKDIEALESEAEFLKPLRDRNSVKLRSDILFKAGSLRARLMQLTMGQEMQEMQNKIVEGIVSIVADVVFPAVPEDALEEIVKEFKAKVHAFLETGRL